jgi:hypothetical protein
MWSSQEFSEWISQPVYSAIYLVTIYHFISSWNVESDGVLYIELVNGRKFRLASLGSELMREARLQ